jgi:hypothetical protein
MSENRKRPFSGLIAETDAVVVDDGAKAAV